MYNNCTALFKTVLRGTVTIFYGSGSDFWQVTVPVPQAKWGSCNSYPFLLMNNHFLNSLWTGWARGRRKGDGSAGAWRRIWPCCLHWEPPKGRPFPVWVLRHQHSPMHHGGQTYIFGYFVKLFVGVMLTFSRQLTWSCFLDKKKGDLPTNLPPSRRPPNLCTTEEADWSISWTGIRNDRYKVF